MGKAVRPLLNDHVKNSMKSKGLPGDEALSFCRKVKKLQ